MNKQMEKRYLLKTPGWVNLGADCGWGNLCCGCWGETKNINFASDYWFGQIFLFKLLLPTKVCSRKKKHFAENTGILVITTEQLIQQSLNSGSSQVKILISVSQRFAMVRISGNGSRWKLGPTPFVG